MLNTTYQRKNNGTTAIDFDSQNQPEISSSYSFSNYAKAGLAIAGTVGTVALANTAGFLPSFRQSDDATADNILDKTYQLINPQKTITFADNSLPVYPRHAKRAFGGEFQINTNTTATQWYPSIAALTTGDFVVVWQSNGQDGDGRGIYGQRYSSTGISQGSEFQVNTYTTLDQQNPSIAALTTGDFVVVWQSGCFSSCIGQDGNSTGVYGQRYSSAGVPQGSEFQVNTYTGFRGRTDKTAEKTL